MTGRFLNSKYAVFHEDTKFTIHGEKGRVDIATLKAVEFQWINDQSIEERRHLGDTFVEEPGDLNLIYTTNYEPGLELLIPPVFVKSPEQG